ncbi:Macrolide export ATP-binding/permease protein MacB [bioreactor metagenome]|uniref:Macrolide export ATP-binding/permease protein MacB n=1 Tax=bioreactor metagenome TaxID=1076179 RepID=A0A645F0B1_9ZZZZ
MGARSALLDLMEQLNQGVIASDLRLPIALLVLVNAALLVAANILILVAERKKEIAVLKAIGARESEIIKMVLAEAMLVSGVGALLGFSLIRVQAFLNQWTNAVGLLSLIWMLFLDLVIILGMTLFAAILFGWIPAKKYASLSVMEVLRNE